MAKYFFGAGINAYSKYPLNGCNNDIKNAFLYLTEHKKFVKGDNTKLVLDGRATRPAMHNCLRWLVDVADKGDICTFQFSGHGTEMPNRNDDFELAGKDQVICCVDFNWETGFITDDELGSYADKIAYHGAIPIFIIDACHSGSILRSFDTARNIPVPFDIESRMTDSMSVRTISSQMNKNAILISGCQDNEVSLDARIDNDYYGAMTYYLLELLKNNPDCTWEYLQRELPSLLVSKGYNQHPTIYIPDKYKDRVVFD